MTRRLVLLLSLAIALGIGACSPQTRYEILSFFFDGVPKPGEEKPPPPTQRVRRLLREIEELKRQLKEAREALRTKEKGGPAEQPQLPAEKAKTWEEALQALPRDSAGHVDWVQALKAETIAPHPGLDPKAPEQAVLELNVDLASSPSKLFSVTFPHGAHTQWLTCGNCHPAIFPLSRRAEPTVVTMAKIRAGQYCGVCHSRVAFGVEGECARCHAKIPAKADWHPAEEPKKPIERATSWDEVAKLLPTTDGMPDWAKALADGVITPRPGLDPTAEDEPVLPLDVELVPADNPAFKVVFPHEAHTAWLSCTTCHPGIFQMAKGADPITMEKIFAGEYCGVCHGKVAFDVSTGCDRCHPAMAPK